MSGGCFASEFSLVDANASAAQLSIGVSYYLGNTILNSLMTLASSYNITTVCGEVVSNATTLLLNMASVGWGACHTTSLSLTGTNENFNPDYINAIPDQLSSICDSANALWIAALAFIALVACTLAGAYYCVKKGVCDNRDDSGSYHRLEGEQQPPRGATPFRVQPGQPGGLGNVPNI